MVSDGFSETCIIQTIHSNTVSIAATAERYSEMYDTSSGDLAIFKIYEESLVDSKNHEANVLIALCWRRHWQSLCSSGASSQGAETRETAPNVPPNSSLNFSGGDCFFRNWCSVISIDLKLTIIDLKFQKGGHDFL